jgi:hypothetical protein
MLLVQPPYLKLKPPPKETHLNHHPCSKNSKVSLDNPDQKEDWINKLQGYKSIILRDQNEPYLQGLKSYLY